MGGWEDLHVLSGGVEVGGVGGTQASEVGIVAWRGGWVGGWVNELFSCRWEGRGDRGGSNELL